MLESLGFVKLTEDVMMKKKVIKLDYGSMEQGLGNMFVGFIMRSHGI
jgi:hypothetical protein